MFVNIKIIVIVGTISNNKYFQLKCILVLEKDIPNNKNATEIKHAPKAAKLSKNIGSIDVF